MSRFSLYKVRDCGRPRGTSLHSIAGSCNLTLACYEPPMHSLLRVAPGAKLI